MLPDICAHFASTLVSCWPELTSSVSRPDFFLFLSEHIHLGRSPWLRLASLTDALSDPCVHFPVQTVTNERVKWPLTLISFKVAEASNFSSIIDDTQVCKQTSQLTILWTLSNYKPPVVVATLNLCTSPLSQSYS